MTSVKLLAYPKKSHRKSVTRPDASEELAEFFGIMMGDGGIGSSWQATITVNAEADKAYIPFLQNLCSRLFGYTPSVSRRKNAKAAVLRISSASIVDFLIERGLPQGDKLRQGLRIPAWILLNPEFRKACVRGLVDTDGCLYIHRHTVAGKLFRNIGMCFCSYSPELIKQVAKIFEEFGIIPHISNRGRSIYLYKASAVAEYLEIFGTSNERIRTVYRGFLEASDSG